MPRVTLKNGELRDQVRMDLYDSLYQAQASLRGTQKFFSNTQGKTLVDTNMRLNGTLENQVSFLVQGVGLDAIVYDAGNDVVLAEMLDASAVKLVIGEKEYLRAPTRYLTGKLRSYNTDIAQYGTNHDSVYALKGHDSIAIPPVQTFSLDWQIETDVVAVGAAATATAIKYIASLKGLMRRPVQ
jgi:hypothetical protein